MNSPFARIYKALIARIQDQVPQIPYIDLDYGQLETPQRPTVAFPCLLINFTSTTFTDISDLAQLADGYITLKLATDPYSSTSNITPETYMDAALEILDLEYAVVQALHGFKPAGTQPMGRTSITSDDRRPGLKVRVLTFTHSFKDTSTKRPAPTIATPTVVIVP